MYGEDGKKESDTDTNRAFYSKSIGTRAKILVAGVTMNILLAILLLGIGHWIGLPAIVEGDEIVEESRVQIVQVSLESPASEAEIKMGDTIREFRISNSEFRINTIKDVQGFTSNHKGDKVIIVIERGDQVLEKEFARYCGVKYGVGVANGVEAIQIALMSLGISKDDEVITPANSCPATALGIHLSGASPVK